MTNSTFQSNDLGRVLYERFMRSEYHADWENLPDGTRARWVDAAVTVAAQLPVAPPPQSISVGTVRHEYDPIAGKMRYFGSSAPNGWLGWENEEKLTVEQAWTILCETPDISSPEEYPDHALITMEQLGSFMARAIPVGTIACPCTTFEQDEDCSIGYPSLLCTACDGKGIAPVDKVVALAAEMLKVAEQVDELEDPFAAWETIDLLKSQATPQPLLGVKPLAWRVPKEDSPKDPSAEDIALCADGIGGIYGISRKQSVGPERLVWWVDDPFTWTGYASIADAKAAAQADHERRVLSCLTVAEGSTDV